MSFLRTMATLAVGFAVAKGIDKFQEMGGGAGLANSLKSASAGGGIGNHVAALMTRMQVPGGGEGLKENVGWLGTKARATGDAAMMGVGGLMAALGGAQWAGSGNARDLLNAMGDGTPPGATMEAHSRLMIRAMVQAAKADGEIDAGERAHIMDVLGDATPEERAFVEAEMDRPVDIDALVAEVGSYQRTAVYAVSVVTANVLNAAEIAYLDRLAAALHLGQAARQRIHKAMRLPQVLS
ncbi:tellurite resistance TerB family protein [Rhodovulum adriaticum]|uniref:Uncharacterized membrane protein YebE (DUF533 family) n=1 Tax=Rhodovulum adriaticum TaxID=35804 RepID=A0A4R2NK38_RHOAD|nr:DUF533 domain-containing protein [Rhodovulum adriaticum]MBK1634677.1 hypothetical protein [Rhodovulum adriaticum]TCP21615.1 uncharacterized membrane protein YebE (DUF533 family) [Rhodovulum adriaticum]